MAPSVLTFALYALLASRGVLAEDVSDANSVAEHAPQGGGESPKGTQGIGATDGQPGGKRVGKHRRPKGRRPSAEGDAGGLGGEGLRGNGGKGVIGQGGEGASGKSTSSLLAYTQQWLTRSRTWRFTWHASWTSWLASWTSWLASWTSWHASWISWHANWTSWLASWTPWHASWTSWPPETKGR